MCNYTYIHTCLLPLITPLDYLDKRLKVDMRQLEDAHVMYAVLIVMKWYPAAFDEKLHNFQLAHFNNTLSEVTAV